jgi:hypothetical protein|eukprot:COSAG01_NODE_11062_length_2017_cov_1.604797_2_plen_142_part_00
MAVFLRKKGARENLGEILERTALTGAKQNRSTEQTRCSTNVSKLNLLEARTQQPGSSAAAQAGSSSRQQAGSSRQAGGRQAQRRPRCGRTAGPALPTADYGHLIGIPTASGPLLFLRSRALLRFYSCDVAQPQPQPQPDPG